MKLVITKISKIPFNKEGEAINVVAIRVGANKPAILRSYDQFLIDLRESFLIGDNVTSMNDQEVLEVLADLQGGTVSGSIHFHKQGDEYEVTEDSPAMTNPNHRLYGKVSVGDKLKAERDGARILEGFLTLKREATAQVIHKSSTQYAKARIQAEGFMQQMMESVGSTTSNTTNVEEFDLDEEIHAEVLGTEGKK